MDKIEIPALAKINLGLDVLGKRADGYHEVKMIMQTISLCDRVFLEKTEEQGIFLECDALGVPSDRTNLAFRAAELLFAEKREPVREGIRIRLEKRIPAAAGMAGGSTDAAAVLKGMNQLFSFGYTEEELRKLGVKLGADIPYCIMGGTALAEGIGEKLTALSDCPEYPVLIAKPSEGVSTKYVYEHLDALKELSHPDLDRTMNGIRHGSLMEMASGMGNVLEAVTIPALPVIGKIKEKMREDGAIISLMSGSGPTVFGLFETEETAKAAEQKMRQSGLAAEIFCGRICKKRS